MAISTFNTCNFHIPTFAGRKRSSTAVLLLAVLFGSLAVLTSAVLVTIPRNGTSFVAAGATGSGGPLAAESLLDSAVVLATPEPEVQAPEPAPEPEPEPSESAPTETERGQSDPPDTDLSVRGQSDPPESAPPEPARSQPEPPAHAAPTAGAVFDAGVPVVSIGSQLSVVEGGMVSVPITLVGGSIAEAIVVNYEVVTGDNNGTGNGTSNDNGFTARDTDFGHTSGRAIIQPGTSGVILKIPTIDDADIEPAETFGVKLTGSSVLSGANSDVVVQVVGEALGVIESSDGAVLNIRIDDAMPAREGTNISFPVSLAGGTVNQNITIGYKLEHISTENFPTENFDFNGNLFGGATGSTTGYGSFTIEANQSNTALTIPVATDGVVDFGETFQVSLASEQTIVSDTGVPVALVQVADPADGTAIGTIIDAEQYQSNVTVVTAEVANQRTSEGNQLVFSASLSENVSREIRIHYEIIHVTTEDVDFSNGFANDRTGTFIFNANSTTSRNQATLTTIRDNLNEATEKFKLRFTSVAGNPPHIAVNITDTATGTISNTAVPAVALTDAQATEGSTLSFPVALTGGSLNKALTVDYQVVANGTGVSAGRADFPNSSLPSGSFTIPMGTNPSIQNVMIATAGDSTVEVNETFSLELTGTNNSSVLVDISDTATGTIVDDDGTTLVAAVSATAVSDGGQFSLPVALAGGMGGEAVTVEYEIEHITTSPDDFANTTNRVGSITIPATTTSLTLPINTANSTARERDEAFKVSLRSDSTPSGDMAVKVAGTAVGVITSDSQPTLTIDSASKEEYMPGDLMFTVTLTPAVDYQVRVNYRTADVSATAGEDYTANSGTLKFNPGDTTKPINIVTAATADVNEPSEIFQIILESPVGATINLDSDNDGINGGFGTIFDRPTLTITPVANTNVEVDQNGEVHVTEGASVTFQANLSKPPSEDVAITYYTSHVTTDAADYTPIPATPVTQIVFSANNSNALTLPIIVQTLADDDMPGRDEHFTLTLATTATSIQLPDSLSTTIHIEDRPTLTLTNGQATEGNTITFAATLSKAPAEDLTLSYTTSSSTGAGHAQADTDYQPILASPQQQLTFAADDTDNLTQTIEAQTHPNDDTDGDETFTLTLAQPPGTNKIQMPTPTATGTIFDMPTLTVTPKTAMAQDDTPHETPQGDPVTFTIKLSQTPSTAVTVEYVTWRSPGAGITNNGYTKASTTFMANTATLTKDIVVNSSTSSIALNEVFSIALVSVTSAGNAQLGTPATAATTIATTATTTNVQTYASTNKPTLSVHDASAREGQVINVPITLSHAINQPITVQFDLTHPDGITWDTWFNDLYFASPDTDYSTAGTSRTTNPYSYSYWATLSGTATIPAGTTSHVIPITTIADNVEEGDEVFKISLKNPSSNAQLASYPNNQALGTITAEKSAFYFSDTPWATEGNAIMATVVRRGNIGERVSVNYATSDWPDSYTSAAETGIDYTATSGRLEFPPGIATRTFEVATISDNQLEGNPAYIPRYESFKIILSNPSDNAVLSSTYETTKEAIITETPYSLQPSDPTILFDITSASRLTAAEDDYIVFNVFPYNTHDTIAETTTINYATSDNNSPAQNGDAQGGTDTNSDYTPASGTLTFQHGDIYPQTIRVKTRSDTRVESPETFMLKLTDPATGAVIDTATAAILDKPTFAISGGQSATEGNHVLFTVTRTGSLEAATVNYETRDNNSPAQNGDAQGGNDRDPDSDYVSVSNGVLEFPAGATTRLIKIPTIANRDTSGTNETFKVRLSLPSGSNAQLGSAVEEATGTIQDKPTVTIEGSEPTSGNSASFTVKLSQPPTANVVVGDTILKSTSNNGSPASGTRNFTPTSSGPITLTSSVTDTNREVVIAGLSINSSNVQLGNPSSAISIVNEKPTLSITGGQAPEGDKIIFTVALSRPLSSDITVNYTFTNDSAIGGTDYTNTTTSLQLARGTVVKTFAVPTIRDTTSTSNKTFMVTLTDPAASAHFRLLSSHKTATGTLLNK